jgi:drug/metabolite transporter (DMT)-like permease
MGTGLIAYPGLRSGVRADVVSVIVLLLGSLSWGLGSLLQRRHPVDLDAIASAAYQQLFGGLGVLSLSFIVGEPLPTPTPMAWLGFAFLLVFGSLFAFTSYLTALRLLPTRVVFTYAYVNPVLAALLGWLFLDERISGWTLGGAALVLLGVAGTFRLKR